MFRIQSIRHLQMYFNYYIDAILLAVEFVLTMFLPLFSCNKTNVT